jgi:PAS domain-containing protein
VRLGLTALIVALTVVAAFVESPAWVTAALVVVAFACGLLARRRASSAGTPAVNAALDAKTSELEHERQRQAAILDSMREAVLALDVEQRIRLANPAALQFFALAQSPVGRTLLETVR